MALKYLIFSEGMGLNKEAEGADQTVFGIEMSEEITLSDGIRYESVVKLFSAKFIRPIYTAILIYIKRRFV